MRAPRVRPRSLRGESGQMAFTMLIALMVIFVLTALSFDAGLWYFGHRDAQNDADAAALAAALELPASDTTNAFNQANSILAANGRPAITLGGSCPTADDNTHIVFAKANGSDLFNQVTVCVRGKVKGFFASLSGFSFVHVSAKATANAGHVDSANVMPWAIVPPDPTCTQASGRTCNPGGGRPTCSFSVCPFGLMDDMLYGFKIASGGNTGVISACGNGASSYRACLSGAASSGFYQAGQTVNVGLQGGNLGQNTNNGLNQRSPSGAWNPGTACDVQSKPAPPGSPIPGRDVQGRDAAKQMFVVNPPSPDCRYRLVLVPILASMPRSGGGSTGIQVLGVATFGVASWNRTNTNNDAFGPTANGANANTPCTVVSGGQPPNDRYDCGFVWGYLMSNVTPPDFLLQKIGNSNNPFAPLLVALTN